MLVFRLFHDRDGMLYSMDGMVRCIPWPGWYAVFLWRNRMLWLIAAGYDDAQIGIYDASVIVTSRRVPQYRYVQLYTLGPMHPSIPYHLTCSSLNPK